MSYLLSARCDLLKCPGVAKNVLMALADMSSDNGYAWPSIERLCQRTDWSYSAVVDALSWLESMGAIRRGRNNGRKTVYWLTPEQYTGARHPDPTIRPDSPMLPGTPAIDGRAFVASEKVRQPDQSANRTSPPTGPTGPPAGPNQSASRTLTPLNPIEQIPPNPPAGGAPGFDEFFAGYPRQVHEASARRAWDKLRPDEALRRTIAAAVGEWRGSQEWRRDGGRFIPKPGNWLRERRWRDQPGIAAPPPPPAAPVPPPEPPATPEQRAARVQLARELASRARAMLAEPKQGRPADAGCSQHQAGRAVA